MAKPPKTAPVLVLRFSDGALYLYSWGSACSRLPSCPAPMFVRAHAFRAVPARAPEAVCLPTCWRSLPGSGSPRSPSPCAVKARQRLTLPDRLRGQRSTRFARSASLVIDGLVAARAHNPALDTGGYKTVNNQGLPSYLRPGGSADAGGVPRSKAGTRGKYIYTFAAAHSAAAVVYGGKQDGVEIPDQVGGDGLEKLSKYCVIS